MANILICIPSIREYKPFLESFCLFLDKIKEQHTVCTFWVKNKKLVDIQNEAVEKFMAGDWNYLLFLDDDHWGHVPEMLECLINANAPMATIKTYIRHFPYMCALMKKLDNSLYMGIEEAQGYVECDVTGFPMTLMRKELFTRLEKPYFREFTDGIREWATDGDFCRRLGEIGIKPIGCFQYCLPHMDITDENVVYKRLNDGMSSDRQMLNFIYDKYRGENLCTAHP